MFLFAGSALAELPKAAQIDRYKTIVLNAIKKKDCSRLLHNIGKLEQLTERLPESMIYAKAKCLLQAGESEKAIEALEDYIARVGSDGKYYQQALQDYTRAEDMRASQRQKGEAKAYNGGVVELKEGRWAEDVLTKLEEEMVRVQPGCFEMGSSPSDPERGIDETQHKVCLNKPFLIAKYEVTQAQWDAVMPSNPSAMQGCGLDCPVERVSWRDVQRFIKKLHVQTGRNYRLPTEAEWEYACRSGGKSEKYCGGDFPDELGWNKGNSDHKTHTVGQKQANGLGIFDMSGNVSEYVEDRYAEDYYQNGPTDDPKGPEVGFSRVNRGGSWRYDATDSRASKRHQNKPGRRGDFLGFRLAMTL